MPAMLEDPTAPVIYRTSGAPPYPTPLSSEIPPSITPRQVTLRDRITIASLLPFSSPSTIPPRLIAYLCQQLNREIEKGDTYPMIAPMSETSFGTYWFQNFGAVMILGEIGAEGYVHEVWRMEKQGVKWEECALGSFYVKPNYPGRSSHVSNGGFLVTEAARNKGVGRLMGEVYLEWAPKLGYTYSVFNLVYETNVASCRIWDALGFKRVGRVKACGNLRSHPEGLVDAIIYGRDLGPEGEDYVSEERFDKIRFYLKHGKYPNGADRAEKSRLRSAATHYKLLPAEEGREGEEDAERLMLRDKEVVSDPQRQYEIARQVHVSGQHGGINKTTATIAEKFHWVRIKETVSLVIKNCPDCKESAVKLPNLGRPGVSNGSDGAFSPRTAMSSTGPSVSLRSNANISPENSIAETTMYDRLVDFAQTNSNHVESQSGLAPNSGGRNSGTGRAPMAHMGPIPSGSLPQYAGIPLDPLLMAAHSQQHQQQHQTRSSYQAHQIHHNQAPQQQHQPPSQQRPHETHFFTPHHHPHSHHHSHQHQQHPTQLSSSTSAVSSHSAYHPQPLHGHIDSQKHAEDESLSSAHFNPDMGVGMSVGVGMGVGRLAAYSDDNDTTNNSNININNSNNDIRASASDGDGGGVGVGVDDAQFDVDVDVDLDVDVDMGNPDTDDADPISVDGGREQIAHQNTTGGGAVSTTTTGAAGAGGGQSGGSAGSGGGGGGGGDDTRLASDRHLRRGDDPLGVR